MTCPFSSGVTLLLKALKRKLRRLIKMQLGDVGRANLGFDGQKVVVGDNQHNGLAGGNRAADGVNRQFVYRAGLRRADIDAPQQILRGNLSFGELGELRPHLRQLLRTLASHILVDLDDLLLHLGDLAFSLSNGRNQLPFSPPSLAASRSSAVNLLIGTSCFSQS